MSDNLFAPIPNSRTGKVACKVCGGAGYDVDPKWPRSWKQAHIRGHSPCPDCGKPLTLLLNGKPRTHTRCPGRQ